MQCPRCNPSKDSGPHLQSQILGLQILLWKTVLLPMPRNQNTTTPTPYHKRTHCRTNEPFSTTTMGKINGCSQIQLQILHLQTAISQLLHQTNAKMVQTPQPTRSTDHRPMERHDPRAMEQAPSRHTSTSQTICSLHSQISKERIPQIRCPRRRPQTVQDHGLLPHSLLQCNSNHLARPYHFSTVHSIPDTISPSSFNLHPIPHSQTLLVGYQRQRRRPNWHGAAKSQQRIPQRQNSPQLQQQHHRQASHCHHNRPKSHYFCPLSKRTRYHTHAGDFQKPPPISGIHVHTRPT